MWGSGRWTESSLGFLLCRAKLIPLAPPFGNAGEKLARGPRKEALWARPELSQGPSRARNLAFPSTSPAGSGVEDPNPPLHPDAEPACETSGAKSRGPACSPGAIPEPRGWEPGGSKRRFCLWLVEGEPPHPPQPSADYPKVGDTDTVLAPGHVSLPGSKAKCS